MTIKNADKLEIADYDRSDCDYIRYWDNRQYEHQSEVLALNRLLPEKGENIIDIGGGYGRLTPHYCRRYNEILLIDTSNKNLQQAEIIFKTLHLNKAKTKEGNVYSLPVKSNSYDTVLMVRVSHHLKSLDRALSEIHRILKDNGTLIMEFSNKCHLKTIIKKLLSADLSYCRDTKPYQHPSTNEQGIFINYHYQYIQKLLADSGYKIDKKISVSNIRIPWLKKVLPLKLMLDLERVLQVIFTPLNLGPSIFIRCHKVNKSD